jgi:SRSO17 transposase
MEIPIFSATHNFGCFVEMFKHYFSVPQYRNFTHYLLGLILCEGKRTIAHMSRSQAHEKDYNRLHNFISTAPWDHTALNQHRIAFFTTMIEEKNTRENAPSTGFLIVDDTVNPKRGKDMPGYCLNYSSTHDEPIPSQAVVATLYHYDTIDLPLYTSLYKDEDYCKKHHEPFKTKNVLFVEQLKNIILPRGIRTIALMDAFYFNRHNCNASKKRGIDSIGRLKSNRRLLTNEYDAYGMSLDKWFYKLRVHPRTFFTKIVIPDSEGKMRQLWMFHKRAYIQNLGWITLIMLSEKLRGKHVQPVFLGSTATDLSPEQIVTYYFKRWAIETFFWTIKERLGFNHYQVRTEQATIRHWLLVIFAYSYAVYLKETGSLSGTFGDILRKEQHNNFKSCIQHIYERIKKRRKNITAIYYELAA